VFLAPPEVLRRQWKVQRDCSRRGYTTDEVLAELDRREPDSAAFIRPQERFADMVVSFLPGEDPDRLDAELTLRDSLPHPDLTPFSGITMSGDIVHIPGDIEAQHAAELEEAIWERLHFATHLRSQRLGEYTIGMDLHRSESLALVQLLILYHLVTGRAAVALGRQELERVAS
jgi:phosphoribulokinase